MLRIHRLDFAPVNDGCANQFSLKFDPFDYQNVPIGTNFIQNNPLIHNPTPAYIATSRIPTTTSLKLQNVLVPTCLRNQFTKRNKYWQSRCQKRRVADACMLDSSVLRRRALLDMNVSSRRDCLQHKMIKETTRSKCKNTTYSLTKGIKVWRLDRLTLERKITYNIPTDRRKMKSVSVGITVVW
jgi:hypothetical protein